MRMFILMVFMAMVNVDVKVKDKTRCSILDCRDGLINLEINLLGVAYL